MSEAVFRCDFKLVQAKFLLTCQLTLQHTGTLAIFGHSGSGKTTLLRCLAGLERPQGFIQMGNEFFQRENIFIKPQHRAIAYVFQDRRLFPHLTIAANLAFALNLSPVEERRLGFDEVVSWFGLEDWLSRKPGQLSGGQQQRVAIARALLTQPQMLLMDEPLTGLDQEARYEILSYIDQIRSRLDLPLLYVSHSLDEVVRVADYMALMDSGRIVQFGSLNQVLGGSGMFLLQPEDIGCVLNVEVVDHDDIYQLTQVKIADHILYVCRLSAARNSRVRIRILASDVGVALSNPENISLQNILAAHVLELRVEQDNASVLVRLELGQEIYLLARITRKSVEQLNLCVGMAVYALVKAIAVLR